jgi:hypothetical protein
MRQPTRFCRRRMPTCSRFRLTRKVRQPGASSDLTRYGLSEVRCSAAARYGLPHQARGLSRFGWNRRTAPANHPSHSRRYQAVPSPQLINIRTRLIGGGADSNARCRQNGLVQRQVSRVLAEARCRCRCLREFPRPSHAGSRARTPATARDPVPLKRPRRRDPHRVATTQSAPRRCRELPRAWAAP